MPATPRATSPRRPTAGPDAPIPTPPSSSNRCTPEPSAAPTDGCRRPPAQSPQHSPPGEKSHEPQHPALEAAPDRPGTDACAGQCGRCRTGRSVVVRDPHWPPPKQPQAASVQATASPPPTCAPTPKPTPAPTRTPTPSPPSTAPPQHACAIKAPALQGHSSPASSTRPAAAAPTTAWSTSGPGTVALTVISGRAAARNHTPSRPGQTVCRSGITTGEQCASIAAAYGDHQYRTTGMPPSRGGDSGAPV